MKTKRLLKLSGFLYICVVFSVYAHDNEPLFNQVNLQAQSERYIPNESIDGFTCR